MRNRSLLCSAIVLAAACFVGCGNYNVLSGTNWGLHRRESRNNIGSGITCVFNQTLTFGEDSSFKNFAWIDDVDYSYYSDKDVIDYYLNNYYQGKLGTKEDLFEGAVLEDSRYIVSKDSVFVFVDDDYYYSFSFSIDGNKLTATDGQNTWVYTRE